MFTTSKDLKGLVVRASDGELGTVDELYFDDNTWGIRYLSCRPSTLSSRLCSPRNESQHSKPTVQFGVQPGRLAKDGPESIPASFALINTKPFRLDHGRSRDLEPPCKPLSFACLRTVTEHQMRLVR